MPDKSTSNTPEGLTGDVVDRRREPEGNNIEGVTADVSGQSTISQVSRVTAEDFKAPCRDNN